MRKKFESFLTSKYILIGLTVICLFFIGTSFFTDSLTKPLQTAVSYVVVPLQKGMNNLGLWVSDKLDNLPEISDVLEKNEELQSQVDALTEENNLLKQETYELDRLRELYELDNQYSQYSKVGANVIGISSDNWYSSLTIDKGSDDGIQVDMNVVASGGLVGIVTEVGSNYAIVKTIVEDNSYVSGMIIDTNETCIVQGDVELMDSGMVHLGYFASDVTVNDGDKIVTSNVSDKYLQGILIGYATNVTADSNNLTQSGYLIPAVDFNNLQEVLVITDLKTTTD